MAIVSAKVAALGAALLASVAIVFLKVDGIAVIGDADEVNLLLLFMWIVQIGSMTLLLFANGRGMWAAFGIAFFLSFFNVIGVLVAAIFFRDKSPPAKAT